MLFKLFSATKRCMPCRALVNKLNVEFPEWKQYIEYIDVDGDMTKEQTTLAHKLGVMGLPSFTDEDKILYRGFKPSMIKEIKQLCHISE